MDDAPKKDVPYDVVRPLGPTEDGEGVHVLRAREGRIEAGEVRALREGKPLVSGEVVRLEARADAPHLYDVNVQYQASPAPRGKPAQVASETYRDNWERVFGAGEKRELN
jgi:hypothetical protein